MGRFLPVVVSVLSALSIMGVAAEDTPACVRTCADTMRNTNFGKYKCSDANALPCLCASTQYQADMVECSKGCAGTAEMVFNFLSTDPSTCQGRDIPKPGSASAASTPAASPTPSAQPSTEAASTPTPAPTPTPTSSAVVSSSVTAVSTPQSSETTSASATAETTAASSTSTESPSQTSDSVASATSSAAAGGATDGSTGLSQGAIVGIGVGVGAGVIALAGIIICMLIRNRRRNRDAGHMEISKPLPGSGRTYDHGNSQAARSDNNYYRRDNSIEKYGADIEMTSQRYEDMVPRTQPRTMV